MGAVSLNAFRLIGDFAHLASFIIIFLKIIATQNVRGLSAKTAGLHCLVFYCRYSDIFYNTTAIYNTVMKAIFLFFSTCIFWCFIYKKPQSESYDKEGDAFPVLPLIGGALIMGFFVNMTFTPFEVMWSFSLWLEAVASLPQIYMVTQFAKEHNGSIENLTADYMFSVGVYRAIYALNWIYRYNTDQYYWDPYSWAPGVIQTIIYADFLYYYAKAHVENSRLALPI